jgi:hypothetical protein
MSRSGREDRWLRVTRRLGLRCGPTGKVRFNSSAHALQRANQILESGKSNTELFRSYQCPHCGGWHLTSKI